MIDPIMTKWWFYAIIVGYYLMAYVFQKWTASYMKGMRQKVEQIDARFVDELYFTINAKTETRKEIITVLLDAIWPVVVIAVVIKAELAYNRIRQHVWVKDGA